MNINAAFKLFDIRGEYPQEVDERLAFIVGKAICNLRRPEKVLVAFDTRESSPTLKSFLIDGLASYCKHIVDIYEAPIPEFYFVMASCDFDVGIMVTASHVSETENGFKFANKKGLPFDQGEILALKNAVSLLENEQIVVPKMHSIRINMGDKYIERVLKISQIKDCNLKLALDVTRSSVVTPTLVIFSKLGCKFQLVKGNHGGNPLLPENRKDLVKKVLETGSDLGIIWDSDGDRVVFVDRKGEMIPPSFVLGILAADAISSGKGNKVAVDVRAGLVVRDLVEKAGGKIEVLPAWAQFLKFAMEKDQDFAFGGETSCHFVFRDFFLIDDGVLAALRFLKIWQKDNLEAKLTSLKKRYFEMPEQNFPCPNEKSTAILENLTNKYRDQGFQVSVEDGLTVFGPNFKFNLRQSVTEPFLRLNLETSDGKTAAEITSQIKKHLTLN